MSNACVLFEIFAATASLRQIKFQLTGFSLYFGDLLCTRSIFQTSSTFVLNCQIKAHQAECVKATEGVLKDLLATQDQEVLHLLKEAAEQEKGKFYSVHGMYPFSDLYLIPQRWEQVHSISYYQNFPLSKIVTLVAMSFPFFHSNDLIISPFQE